MESLFFSCFVSFHCHLGILILGGLEAELYLLDCFHSVVHGSLVGGNIMIYEHKKEFCRN